MRRRKKKGADEKLISYTDYVIYKDVHELRGKWRDVFNSDSPIYVEIGSGKGKFIVEMAQAFPDKSFISIERKEECLLKGVEKAIEGDVKNIKFLWLDAVILEHIFDKGELEGIYLNFSDPWPKTRHAKRRLTHKDFLRRYEALLSKGGGVFFKTDNRDLFEFSINELSDEGWRLKNISLNLAGSDIFNITTEYEEKFMAMNMPIYRVEAYK